MATKQEVVEAIGEALQHQTRRRRRTHNFNESMQMYLGSVAAFALLNVFIPGMLSSTLTLVFIGGALLASVFALIEDRRRSNPLWRTLVLLVLGGALMYGIVYGTHWYFMVHLLSQPNPFGTFGASTPSTP